MELINGMKGWLDERLPGSSGVCAEVGRCRAALRERTVDGMSRMCEILTHSDLSYNVAQYARKRGWSPSFSLVVHDAPIKTHFTSPLHPSPFSLRQHAGSSKCRCHSTTAAALPRSSPHSAPTCSSFHFKVFPFRRQVPTTFSSPLPN